LPGNIEGSGPSDAARSAGDDDDGQSKRPKAGAETAALAIGAAAVVVIALSGGMRNGSHGRARSGVKVARASF
jgi:hypothetical protein